MGSSDSDSVACPQLETRMLDHDECERARVRRDRRYDGRFFSGVRTTRVYCRPVCPVRLQRAKRLLDQTWLPMSKVAVRAGFASLRRFNAVFAEVYGRTPSDVRRLRFKPV